MNSPNFKKLINDLIRAYEAIKNENPNERLLSFGDYSRDDIFRTTYFILKSQFPAFNKITKQEFEELPTDDKITALHEILNNPQVATLPKDLEEMLQNIDKKEIGEGSHKELNIQAAINTPENRLRRMLNSMEVNDAVDQVVPSTPAPIEVKQVESIQILLQNPVLKKEFDDKLPEKISERTKASPTRSQEIARFYEKYITEVPDQQEAAGIDITKVANIAESQEISSESILAELEVEPVSEIAGAMPLGSMFLRTAVEVSLPTAAKTDPVNATAKAFYYQHGYTASSFRTVAREIGLTPSQTQTFTNYLTTFGSAHPDFAAMLAGERAAINPQQIERIFRGPGTLYQNYINTMPPVTGITGFFLRASQQTFGGIANNFVERSIRSSIQGAAKKVAGSFIGKALGAIGSVVSKTIGIVTGPLINLGIKAFVAFRNNFGKALAFGGSAAVVGGLLGGPIGALVGGVVGAAVSGTDRKQLENWVKWALAIMAALLASIFGAIAIPLTITFVVVPILVVLVVFIINSGAYVVPPGSPIGDLTGTSGLSGITQTIASPYIDVIKTATPAGPFENGATELKNITYKVTVRAKKGSLKNIKFTNTCQVITKTNPYGQATCTAPLPKEEDMPQVIDPGKNYVFSYTMDLSSFTDAFVVDTFNVTADASEKIGAVSAASASVKIGKPPESCPSGWPVDEPVEIIQGPGGAYSHSGYQAIDIPKNAGTPVRATHSGIAVALNWTTSYGNNVRINSSCGGKSFQSVYGHLEHILVTTGQVVTAGQIIGTVDNTGNSKGNHLHYEFRPVLSGTNDGPVGFSDEPIPMAPPYIPNL